MRIAVCYQWVHPSRGGAETYVGDLCRSLTCRGHSVELYAEDWSADALPGAVHCHRIRPIGCLPLARIWSFAAQAAEELRHASDRYDCSIGLINTWGQDILIPQGGVRAASLAANAQRHKAGLARSAYRMAKQANLKWWLYQAIERRQFDPRAGSHIVAVSKMVRAHLRQYHTIAPERIHVIHNAIDATRLAVPDHEASRRAFRSSLGLFDRDLVALFIGHNYRLKGLGPLLSALALRREQQSGGREIHLVVCGGGKPAEFQRQARRLGLSRWVHFAGFQPDVRNCYHGSDLFVLPTYYDPCSLVVFEALACGLPIITTRCNGSGELIREGEEGFIIGAPGDAPELARALDALCDDATRVRMAQQAIALGRAQSFDKHVDRLLKVAELVACQRDDTRSIGRARRSPMFRARPVGGSSRTVHGGS